jgi:hypothetical protein
LIVRRGPTNLRLPEDSMSLSRTLFLVITLGLAGATTAIAQAANRQPAARTPHLTAGERADCLSCHAQGANEHITAVPAAHRYANAACVACHRPAETMPPSSQHPMDAAHARCAACHVAGNRTGAKPAPASHDHHASTCQICHQAAPLG